MTPVSAEPVIIAHRGASAVAPENTRAAIATAIEMGAGVIEFDVRETKDGELVLFHDDSLERFLGRTEAIEDLQWKEVSRLDVGSWFEGGDFSGETPMLLDEAIRLCLAHGATPLIERKSGSAASYAKVIRDLEVTDEVIVQSFDWSFLESLSGELPGMTLGALGSKDLDRKKMTQLRALKPNWVGWKYSDLSSGGLKLLQENRFKVALWTVNDPETTREWLERGVDAIITDHPDTMMRLIAR